MAAIPEGVIPDAPGYTNPYEEQRKLLEERYRKEIESALEAQQKPIYTPEAIEQRRAVNQAGEQMGALGVLSNYGGIGQLGKSLYAQALKERQPEYKEHGVFDPLEGKFQFFPGYAESRRAEMVGRSLGRTELAEQAYAGQWDRDRQRAHEQAQLRLTLRAMQPGGGGDASGLTGPAPEVGQTLEGRPIHRVTKTGKYFVVNPATGQAEEYTGTHYKKENLGATPQKELEASASIFNNIVGQIKTFQPNYARSVPLPGVGMAENFLGRIGVPGLGPQSDWWKGTEAILNEIRHGLYGAALTKTEKAAFERASINVNFDSPTAIQNWMHRMAAIAEQVHIRQTRMNQGFAAAERERRALEQTSQQYRQSHPPPPELARDWEILNLGRQGAPPQQIQGAPPMQPQGPGIPPQGPGIPPQGPGPGYMAPPGDPAPPVPGPQPQMQPRPGGAQVDPQLQAYRDWEARNLNAGQSAQGGPPMPPQAAGGAFSGAPPAFGGAPNAMPPQGAPMPPQVPVDPYTRYQVRRPGT